MLAGCLAHARLREDSGNTSSRFVLLCFVGYQACEITNVRMSFNIPRKDCLIERGKILMQDSLHVWGTDSPSETSSIIHFIQPVVYYYFLPGNGGECGRH